MIKNGKSESSITINPKNSETGIGQTQKLGFLQQFRKAAPWFASVVVIIAVTAFGTVQYRKAVKLENQVNQLKASPQKTSQDEIKDIINKVGQLIVLPENEQPTLATVTDPELLKSQPFFANARTDDKVLIYNGAKKAILYRPSENRIIEVAPINLGASGSQSATASEAPVQAVSIAVLNGSGTTGLAKKAAEKLKAAGFTVSRTGDASASTQTTIQYKTGKDQEANSINSALGGQATLQQSNTIKEDIQVTLGKTFTP